MSCQNWSAARLTKLVNGEFLDTGLVTYARGVIRRAGDGNNRIIGGVDPSWYWDILSCVVRFVVTGLIPVPARTLHCIIYRCIAVPPPTVVSVVSPAPGVIVRILV
jgi:hypothetical protein